MSTAPLDGLQAVVYLEHILHAVAGDEGLNRARLDIEGRISHLLDQGEKMTEQAKRQRTAAVLGIDPRRN